MTRIFLKYKLPKYFETMMKVNQKIISKFKSSTLSDSSSQSTIALRNNFHFPSTSSITSTGVMTNVLSSNVNQCQLKLFTVQYKIQLEFTLRLYCC